jgi:hypothetical protein
LIETQELLAKPEIKQEPVAWINAITGDTTTLDCSDTLLWAPLYLEVPTRKPIPNSEIKAAGRKASDMSFYNGVKFCENYHRIGKIEPMD